jgi:ectoine hydroxylase-related dioxygenase (phytanoyl-CoA dioxygenase family)
LNLDILKITSKQIKIWKTYGYVYCPNHLKKNIDQYINSVKIIESLDKKHRESLFYYEEIKGKARLCRIEKFINDNSFLKKQILGKDILGYINKLNSKPFNLYKEKINIKFSGGSGYSAHQDATAYHKLKGHITCLIALTEMNEENGCLYISKLKNNNKLLSYDRNGCIKKSLDKNLLWNPIIMSKGDCLFFNSYLPHKSESNRSKDNRKAIYLTFNLATEGNLRNEYYKNREKSLNKDKNRISTIGHFKGKNII